MTQVVELPAVPVFINARDRLSCLQQQLAWLETLEGVGPITIFDNASTYPPLLDFYASGAGGHKVCRSEENYGPNGVWRSGVVLASRMSVAPFYVVVDEDVVGAPECPKDVFEVCIRALLGHPEWRTVGLSLDISDLPESYHAREKVLEIESKYWETRWDDRWWNAPIDSANFPVYRAGQELVLGGWQPPPTWTVPLASWWHQRSIAPVARCDRPYILKHLPWYWDYDHLTEEQRYYLDHVREDVQACWALRAVGHLRGEVQS